MSDNNKTPIAGHDYDGIQEFDNPLPAWWLATFLGTIIFAFLYWIHYTWGGAPTQLAEMNQDLKAIQSLQKSTGGGAEESEELLARLLASSETKDKGRAVFAAKCAVCHGPELQGLIGPNLTDDYWIHGKGTAKDVLGVVRKGVLDKGMPAWEAQLNDEDIRAVSVFVISRRGSHPPNPKAPQGEKIAQ